MFWEKIYESYHFAARRSGRFVAVELLRPHRVLSTSAKNGGQREHLRFLINHQSCEGSDHRERHDHIAGMGQERYHDAVCAEIGVNPDEAATMGTAANMNYISVVTQRDENVEATALVTAGVQGNAACAGDPAGWREQASGWQKLPQDGTINTILLVNVPLTESALARAVVTMTEGKSAALQRLAVRSLYSPDFATGTGTDQYCIGAPLEGDYTYGSTSPHVKLGELIGAAVRDATAEALRWQNGLEPSYTRSLFHALGCYGIREKTIYQDLGGRLSERELTLLEKNSKSVFFEPLVSAAAFAVAAVLDRVRCGTLPSSCGDEALRQQACNLAVSLSAKPQSWGVFHEELADASVGDAKAAVLNAIARGWSAKWR